MDTVEKHPTRSSYPNRPQHLRKQHERLVRRWLFEQARAEYREYLNRKCPLGSADGYKESRYHRGTRSGGLMGYVQNRARKSDRVDLSDVADEIRDRWHVPSWKQLEVV